ncbi:MAG: hypothetical protein K2W95_00435 [Candidatus Obscuribacterales bacterium]|nr:hypothetical protein [Candidatus Obscuribacterales bacterium]
MANVFLYSHTHWDREWYQPFEVFRLHLTSVVKRVLRDLETGRLSRFFLDGQAIVLEDVMELEPDLAPRVSALMKKGELAAGPWYVLPDQMLVSGESLIRNLQFGINTVAKFGTPSLTGYCPDTFGHSHDLPRILRGFGIESAFVWRGVPELGYGPLFWWESPDGSRVLTWHFARGYYQTLMHEGEADTASRAVQIREHLIPLVTESGPQDGTAAMYCKQLDAALFPCGADHTAPPTNFSKLVDSINDEDFQVTQIQLADFAALLQNRVTSSPTVVGLLNRELRDNKSSKMFCNAYLLPGVLSTRLYLKQENRQSERRLARFDEPLFSQLHARGLLRYPQPALDYAWKLLLRNHPHDSICGCSVDAVHDEMQSRTAKLNQVLSTLEDEAHALLSGLSAESPLSPEDPDRAVDTFVVANPSVRECSAPVPFSFYAPCGTKFKNSSSLQISSQETSEELFGGWGRIPYYKNVVKFEGWFWADKMPACGITGFNWPVPPNADSSGPPIVAVRSHSIDNGWFRLSVNDNGEIHVLCRESDKTVRNYSLEHKLRDVGDGGDTYNFDPIEGDKPIQGKLKSVEQGEKGPLRGSLKLTYEIKIPECIIEAKASTPPVFKRSSRLVTHVIQTEIWLNRGGRLINFTTRWDNQALDHRLEVLLDTGEPVNNSWSENHFALIKRLHTGASERLPVERGNEAAPDRFPAQRFVLANGQILFNDGLPEYGAEGRHLTLTLLRSVGILSRGQMRTRGGGAGPHLPTPGAQCKGKSTATYAWAPLPQWDRKNKELFDRLPEKVSIIAYDLAEEFERSFLTGFASSSDLKANGLQAVIGKSLFRIGNNAIQVAGLHVTDNRLVARFLNTTEHPQQTLVHVDTPVLRADLCRLDETPMERLPGPFDGELSLQLEFQRYQLKTISFTLSSNGGSASCADSAVAKTSERVGGEASTDTQSSQRSDADSTAADPPPDKPKRKSTKAKNAKPKQ